VRETLWITEKALAVQVGAFLCLLSAFVLVALVHGIAPAIGVVDAPHRTKSAYLLRR
jgi:hypothetical protein